MRAAAAFVGLAMAMAACSATPNQPDGPDDGSSPPPPTTATTSTTSPGVTSAVVEATTPLFLGDRGERWRTAWNADDFDTLSEFFAEGAVAAFAFAVVAVVGVGLAMSLSSTSQRDGAARTASEATTFARLAEDLGGSPIPDAETMLIAGGEGGIVPGSGYLIENRAVENHDAFVGVALYQYEEPGDAAVYSCLSDFAKVGDFYLEGSGGCTPDLSLLASMAAANLTVAQLCGPVPINPSIPDSQPQLDSDWTIAGVWGVPRGVDTVRFTLGDGSVVSVEASESGYAHLMKAGLPGIASIDFDGMTEAHRRLATSLLPMAPTNCTYNAQG